MNQRIRELAVEARLLTGWPVGEVEYQKFAELIVKECIDTLLWHGCDDAVPYIEWMAKNKLGIKE